VLMETMIWVYSSCWMGALNIYLLASEIFVLGMIGLQFGLHQIRVKYSTLNVSARIPLVISYA